MKIATSAMKLLVFVGLLALACVGLTCADQQQPQQNQPQQQQQQSQPQPQQLQPSGVNKLAAERQARSLSGSSPSTNSIEITSDKAKLEQEKRQVQEFLTAKNIFKSIVKLLFGNQAEIGAASRSVIDILSKVLDLLKNTFSTKNRSGNGRTIRDSAEDAANAGVSMLQGYVKSVLANDEKCIQKYLCQASREAVRDSQDLGYIIATAGGYMSSYMLDSSRYGNFKSLFDATKKGQSVDDCNKIYPGCVEDKKPVS